MTKIIKKNYKSSILILDKLDKKIKFKRIFFLIANKIDIRGKHAHKKCTQAFFSIRGSFLIECINKKEKKKYLIKPGEKLRIIKPMNWVTVFLKKNDICAVLCDRHYEENDYIRDYKTFLKFKLNEKKN